MLEEITRRSTPTGLTVSLSKTTPNKTRKRAITTTSHDKSLLHDERCSCRCHALSDSEAQFICPCYNLYFVERLRLRFVAPHHLHTHTLIAGRLTSTQLNNSKSCHQSFTDHLCPLPEVFNCTPHPRKLWFSAAITIHAIKTIHSHPLLRPFFV